ncbi:MAG: hypothetical protein Q7K03_12275 [Dehalococcoidia bacterium]|nr:hypothetical protein [Dehalococcoidia bacterium]
MPRGGKRPGAGARKGNLNALKHGRNSQQVEDFMLALLSMPRIQEILAAYYRRHQRTERQATKVVQGLLQELSWHIPPSQDNQFILGPLLQDSRYKNQENHDNSIKDS